VQRTRKDKNAALESYGQALAIFGALKEPAEEANVRRAIEEMQMPQSEQVPLSESNQQVYEDSQPSPTAIPSLNIHQPLRRVPRIKRAVLFGLIFVIVVGIITLLTLPLLKGLSFGPNTITPTVFSTSIATNLPNPYFPSGTLVLNDPLINNGNGNWFEGGTSNSACVFTSGAYHVFALQPDITIFCPAKNTNFRNFAYQAQMSIIKGDIGGFIFRLGTHNNFYLFGITAEGYFNLSIHNGNDGFRTLTTGTSPAINVGLSRTNLIAIVVNGSRLDLYINFQHVASAIDSTYSSGEIGVFAASQQNQTEVMFNNARVWLF
jgi:hypothetical protein